jgi:phthiodiolone/phenolphthiodiolone dimycocerosates ketoreductase
MQFGIADPCVNSRVLPDLVLRSTRAFALATGAHSILLPDHLIGVFPRTLYTTEHCGLKHLVPDLDACYEPWTVLGRLAARNRLPRVRLGTAMTDSARRHPAVTAQAVATLHQLSRGRAILGIGAGESMNRTPFGVPSERPVAIFEEALATIRALWDAGGQPVSRESPFFPLRDALFTIPPHRGKWPEIWVGAEGPRMRRAAAKYGDAWLPGVTMDAGEYGRQLAGIRDDAANAGRDPGALSAAKYFFVAVGDSPAMVDDVLNAPIVRWYALAAPGKYWAQHGARHPLGDDFGGVNELLPHTIDASTAIRYIRSVPDSLIRQFVLSGTPDELLDKLAVWRDAGMQYPLVLNMGMLHPSLTTGFRTNLPFARFLRGIRKLGLPRV